VSPVLDSTAAPWRAAGSGLASRLSHALELRRLDTVNAHKPLHSARKIQHVDHSPARR
jgi:hypothetical protein